jgi:hypothetical protein
VIDQEMGVIAHGLKLKGFGFEEPDGKAGGETEELGLNVFIIHE